MAITERANAIVADRLREAADLLEQQAANPFRVQAFRHAADTVARLPQDIDQLEHEGGVAALVALPHIGQGIAAAIVEILHTGRWVRLDRLRGVLDPVHLFQSVPGIGPELAKHIHDALHVDTLEALEIAAHDGRLESVPGVGPRRAAIFRAALSSMLSRRRVRRPAEVSGPSVADLLAVDADYRSRAEAGKLPTIVPKRFNPEHTSWLPVLHVTRGDWHFTALYSNTARAHELGRTRDWVVVYFNDEQEHEGQHTVVTETHGPLVGRRVVRGREQDCRQFYAQSA
jgi:putative hydrolase